MGIFRYHMLNVYLFFYESYVSYGSSKLKLKKNQWKKGGKSFK